MLHMAVGRRTVIDALNALREVQGLPHGQLRDVVAVLVHVRGGARHHELLEAVPVVRDLPVDLRAAIRTAGFMRVKLPELKSRVRLHATRRRKLVCKLQELLSETH